ncbi:MAG: UDP-N-acetylmuramate--L-alanine ligase, partial [bacterium]
IRVGHSSINLDGAEVVVVSSAITINNPEVKSAIRRGIPILHRSEMLSLLMSQKKGIAVAGTHGKTTTTSLVSLVVENAGLDPTVVIGGEVQEFHSNAKFGKGEILVAEADESDGSLVRLTPSIGIITNIEADHMDYYADLAAIRKTFERFLAKIPQDGSSILCVDDPNVKMLSDQFSGNQITYGLNNGARLKAVDIHFTEYGTSFTVTDRGLEIGRFSLRIPGLHNIYNALAAIGVAMALKIDFDTVRQTLREFKGAKRRFEVISSENGVTIVDDYAHHPTEIMATLSAARKVHQRGRIISVFQPHRYTRTKYFFELYGQSFFNSDQVVVTEIYPAGEKPIPSVTGELVARTLQKYGHTEVTYIPEVSKVTEFIRGITRKDDLVITLGAGDVWKVAHELSLKEKSA